MTEETQAAEATDTKAKAEKAKAPKDEKNGVTRPKTGTATGRVWEIADSLSAQAGEPAKRKDVIEAFSKEGGNVSTAATQYGRWRKYHGLGKEAKAEDAKESAEG